MVIEENKFATVTTNSLKDFGVKKGQLVFIGGSGFSPTKKPYEFRMKFIAAFVVNDHITVNEDDMRMFYIDPKHLKLVSDAEQVRLAEIAKQDFGDKEKADTKE